MTDDARVLSYGIYVLWAVASVTVWAHDFRDAWRYYRTWHDERARREFIDSAGLFIVAAASFLSLVIFVFGQSIVGLRGFAIALALGSFLAVGFMRWTFARRQRRRGKYGRRPGDRA